jgi:hypothetical protein
LDIPNGIHTHFGIQEVFGLKQVYTLELAALVYGVSRDMDSLIGFLMVATTINTQTCTVNMAIIIEIMLLKTE